MKAFLLLFLFSAVLFLHASPKFVSNYETLARFDKNPWKYMSKFAIAPGKGEFEGRFQFEKSLGRGKNVPKKINMTIFVYLDEDWDLVRNLDTCEAKANYSRLTKGVQIPTDGSWSPKVSGFLTQRMRTHVWFFVLADCERNVSPYIQGNRLKWELEIRNSDRSQFSEEENGMIGPMMLVLAVIVGFFVSNSIKFVKFYRTEESIDYPTLVITIALFIELLSVGCEIMHMWIYSVDGSGSFLFNFANQALSITSQFLITCLLLLMAHGWSIKFLKFEDMDVFIPLGILLGIIHILIVGVGRITDDESYRFHDYENWAGAFVMMLRVFLFAFWVYLFRETYQKTTKESEKNFFNQFGVLSTLYFLAVPVTVGLATTTVAPYWRHKVVTIGTLLLQVSTLVIFTLLFTTKSNKYYQISMKGKTLLPSDKLS